MMNKIKDIYLTFLGIIFYKFHHKSFVKRSKKSIIKYQFKKLKNLLIDAGTNVPYYNKLFKEIDFNPKRDFKK